MQIIPFERARYHVIVHGDTFLVDLLLYRGSGCCSCFQFLKYFKPEIEAKVVDPEWRPTDANRCAHLRACRGHILDLFLTQLALLFPDNELEP